MTVRDDTNKKNMKSERFSKLYSRAIVMIEGKAVVVSIVQMTKSKERRCYGTILCQYP